jgi:hypothetical protein
VLCTAPALGATAAGESGRATAAFRALGPLPGPQPTAPSTRALTRKERQNRNGLCALEARANEFCSANNDRADASSDGSSLKEVWNRCVVEGRSCLLKPQSRVESAHRHSSKKRMLAPDRALPKCRGQSSGALCGRARLQSSNSGRESAAPQNHRTDVIRRQSQTRDSRCSTLRMQAVVLDFVFATKARQNFDANG